MKLNQRLLKLLGVLLLLFGLCAGAFGLLQSILYNTMLGPPPGFCTQGDEVYQTILASYEGWVETFRSRSTSSDRGAGVIHFDVPSGKQYDATALWDLWRTELPTKIAVPVVTWPGQGSIGAVGYLYSPTGEFVITGNIEYEFERFSGDVYCYRRLR